MKISSFEPVFEHQSGLDGILYNYNFFSSPPYTLIQACECLPVCAVKSSLYKSWKSGHKKQNLKQEFRIVLTRG